MTFTVQIIHGVKMEDQFSHPPETLPQFTTVVDLEDLPSPFYKLYSNCNMTRFQLVQAVRAHDITKYLTSPRMHVKGPQISVGRGRQKNVWHLNLIFEVTCGAPFAILTMFYNVRKLIWNPKEAEKTSPPCIFYWPDGPDCGRKVFSLGEDYFIHFVKRRHMTQLLSNVY